MNNPAMFLQQQSEGVAHTDIWLNESQLTFWRSFLNRTIP